MSVVPVDQTRLPWLSAYLFFDGDIYSGACDRFILQTVEPTVELLNLAPDQLWFFIRYVEGGPQVRLRVQGSSEWIEDVARPIFNSIAGTADVRKLVFVDYEPEIERYGGPAGVRLAEQLFRDSSKAALALLKKSDPDNRSTVFGKALLAAVVQLYVFFQDRDLAAAAAEHYGTNYLRAQVPDPDLQERWIEVFVQGFDRQADRLTAYIEATWEALEDDAPLTPELDAYRSSQERIAVELNDLFRRGELLLDGDVARDWEAVAWQIVSSYLHMMNNRLGVGIREECYLSVLISKVLGDVAQVHA